MQTATRITESKPDATPAPFGSHINCTLTKPFYLAAVSLFTEADTSHAREELKYVYVTRAPSGGVFLVATNGHVFMVFLDRGAETNTDFCIQVDKEFLKSLKEAGVKSRKPLSAREKKEKKAPEGYTVKIEDGITRLIEVGNGNTLIKFEQRLKTIDSLYPDWQRAIHPVLVSENIKVGTPTFASKYLQIFINAVEIAYGKNTNCMCFKSKDDASPIGVEPRLSDKNAVAQDWYGVLMPRLPFTQEEPPAMRELKTCILGTDQYALEDCLTKEKGHA